jgi:hypothetical protein
LFGEIRVRFVLVGRLRGARKSAAAITKGISGDVDAFVMSVRWGAAACVQASAKNAIQHLSNSTRFAVQSLLKDGPVTAGYVFDKSI